MGSEQVDCISHIPNTKSHSNVHIVATSKLNLYIKVCYSWRCYYAWPGKCKHYATIIQSGYIHFWTGQLLYDTTQLQYNVTNIHI